MLTAKYIDTEEELIITNFDNPREEIQKNRLVCKFCDGKMSIKQGLIKSNHFFHLMPCTSQLARHQESVQHNYGKQLIAQHIKTYWKEYATTTINFEMPLIEINRIADIAMIFPSGWIVVHEVQLSSITTEQLQQRTNDYQSIGIDAFWWLGKSADTTANRDWCIKKFGYSLSLNYDVLNARTNELHKGKTQ